MLSLLAKKSRIAPLKLLIVEDDIQDSQFIQDLLATTENFVSEITHVTQLQTTLETLIQQEFDAILLDLELPDSQGLATIYQLHSHNQTTPIIVLTAENDQELAIQAIHAGAQDYLVKGNINRDLLSRAIRYAIERHDIQHQLRQSEQKWRSYFENSLVGVAIYEPSHQWTEVNQALCELLGYEREELLQKSWKELTHPQDIRTTQKQWQEILAGNSNGYVLDTRLRRRDQQIIYTRISIRCIRQANGVIDHLIAVILDLTDHYRDEQELRDSQQRLAMALEGSALGFWDWNVNTRQTYFSPQWKQMLGYEVNEVPDSLEAWERLIHPEDLPKVMEVLNSYLEGKRPIYEVEYRMLSKTGEWKWILDLGKVFERDRAGDPVRMTGTHKDISDRKQAEAALWESETKNRALLNVIPDLIFHVSREGFFLDYQPAKDEASLVPPESYIGKHISEVFGADLAEWNRYYIELTLASHQVQVGEYTLPMNNTWQIYEARYVASGEDSVLAIVRNITQRKQSEASLLELGAKLKYQTKQLETTVEQLKSTQSQLVHREKMASLGQLVAGIAHEINNPVSFIAGNISPALEYANDLFDLLNLYQEHYPQATNPIAERLNDIDLDFIRQDFPKLLQSILAGTHRIQQIVLSLRNFSRLDEAEMKKVDIHSGIDSTLLILQHRLRLPAPPEGSPITNSPRLINIIRDFSPLPAILCYPGQLNQVLMNILSNAIDALEERATTDLTFKPQIVIRTEQTALSQILIRIADNGPGIPLDAQKRLFDPFYTTKPVGKGTGLGLSMSYSIIVEKHQGQLTCHSQVGQGTEFMITLPLIS